MNALFRVMELVGSCIPLRKQDDAQIDAYASP
jgi:hypothetical protein